MRSDFDKGDRVALNQEWVTHNAGRPDARYPKGREAAVIGFTRIYPECIRVVFDGQKTPTTFHESFFSLVRRNNDAISRSDRTSLRTPDSA